MAAFDPYYEWLGIPPKDQPPHHYRLLGIELYESHLTAIDAAANRIMAYLQELSNGDNGALAQQLLNEVSAARVCLLNKKRKASYDQTLKTKLSNKKQKKKNRPAVAKKPPPLPTANPEEVEVEEEAPFPEIGKTAIPQISTEDKRQGTAPAATSRRAKQGEKRIVMVVISLLLIVAVALGIAWFRQPKAPSKTEKAPAPRNASFQHPQDELHVIYEADGMVLSLVQDINKQPTITKITMSLIRPHWKQIASKKLAKRTECYQLAIKHAEKLLEDHGSVEKHRRQRAGTSKQPLAFDDRANRAAEKSYHNKYGKEFDTELNELLDTSE